MALTRRGLTVVVVVGVVLVGAIVGVIILSGGKAKVRSQPNDGSASTGLGPSSTPSPPPTTCPLTGVDPSGTVPSRPALAIKVENLPVARPQTGLSHADIIYEEPVEGGITRFIVVYQCDDATRVEPVRSGRLTDPGILTQFGHPLFGYSGAVPQVVDAVRKAGIIDVNFNKVPDAYHRDPDKPAPHNLYTSTQTLYRSAKWDPVAPKPLFSYSTGPSKGKKVAQLHLPFSASSDVYWKWSSTQVAWLRFHGDVPHTYSDGTQVNAKDVVVLVVKVTLTDITDVNGVRSPEVISTGTGKVYVFRNGRMIVGTWSRPGARDIAKLVDGKGRQIKLDPGNTWVELYPSTLPVEFG
jgi:hypothetical protein